MKTSSFIAGLLCLGFIHGCGNLVIIPPDNTKQNTVKSTAHKNQSSTNSPLRDPRIKYANKLDKKGEFSAALIQWKILSTKYPNNTEFKQRISSDKSLIERKIKLQLRIAKKALSEKKFDEAELEFLKVLALDPHHPEPIANLRLINELNQMQKQSVKLAKMTQKRNSKSNVKQTQDNYQLQENGNYNNETKAEEEQDQERYYLELGMELFNNKEYLGSIREIEKFLNTYPDDELALKQISKAYMALGIEYLDKGMLKIALTHFDQSLAFNPLDNPELIKKIENTRYALAEKTYQRGMRVYRNDLDEAINYFKISLQFFPKHVKSKIALNKALKMREKLNSLN